MADIKKIALTTIGAPKKEKKTKSVAKTVRFKLTLGESNEKSCPEFNYKDLLATEGKTKQHNGSLTVPDDEEDEAGMRALARKFEEKYGGGGDGKKRKKKKRNEDYVDLGAGYDENDSFIDNTDAYDEIVPEEMTTAQGGFYINCGKLEYKQLEIPEEPDDPASDAEEIARSHKRVKQAIVSSDGSSDDDDEDDDDEDSREEEIPSEPEPKVQVIPINKLLPPASKPQEETKKLKRPAEAAAAAGPSKKKSTTVKDLLREKRDHVPERKEPQPVAPTTSNVPSKVPATPSSIADSIESVINAAWTEPEVKVPSPAVTPAVTAPPTVPAEPLRLPDGLTESVKSLANSLRVMACNNGGVHGKFFTSSVDRSLIRLDQRTQDLPNHVRLQIFAYIAEKVVCTPERLLKKARKLALLREKAKSKEPINKLKAAIDQLAPAVLEIYQQDCLKFNKIRFLEHGDVSPPPKVFPWTVELRSLLGEMISQFPQKDDEKLLRTFLENQVCPLFPNGWMNLSTLQQEAHSLFRPKENPQPVVVNTPSSPPQRSTSVITLAESPRLPESAPRPPSQQATHLSLKQRILQDAVGGAFEQDDGGLGWQVKSESHLQTASSNPLSVDKLTSNNDPKPGKSSTKEKKPSTITKPQSARPVKKQDTSRPPKLNNARKKWSIADFTELLKEPEPPPPPPPPPVTTAQDELDDKNKLIEETTAATDYLSQIIHESLSGFPNAETHMKDDPMDFRRRERHSEPMDFHSRERKLDVPLDFHPPERNREERLDFLPRDRNQNEPLEFLPRERNQTEPLELYPRERNREEPVEFRSRERKHSENRTGHATPEPPGLDPEVSVQLEMKRVMQELMELNGQMSGASEPPKLSPVHDRLKARSVDSPGRSPETSPYEGVGRSRVDKARGLSSSQLSSEVSITPTSHYNATTPPDKRTSGVSVIAVNQSRGVNPLYGGLGFQEEFQRHLMQEPPDVVLVSSSPPSAFRPNPSRQQANPYSGLSQPLPLEDLRTAYYNQVHHMNNHGRVQQYPDLQPK